MLAIGVDIGGTKCAVCLGKVTSDGAEVIYKCTPRETKAYSPEGMLAALAEDAMVCIKQAKEPVAGIGVSCGSPLDSRKGLILSPPNLPGWDSIPITDYLTEKTSLPAWLCNDANAGALVEWRYGAGRGASDLIFLTFGTGFGAGLILNGRLYPGASDMAGEIGHVRLSDFGPVGYGKAGSCEGFCSGGGIAQLAQSLLREELQMGHHPALCPRLEGLSNVTARTVGDAAKAGDPLAREILRIVGIQLGRCLAILVDVLNPERIVIGSIFARCHEEIWPAADEVLRRETLPGAYNACQVVPSELSESVGDIAALAVASYFAGQDWQ